MRSSYCPRPRSPLPLRAEGAEGVQVPYYAAIAVPCPEGSRRRYGVSAADKIKKPCAPLGAPCITIGGCTTTPPYGEQ